MNVLYKYVRPARTDALVSWNNFGDGKRNGHVGILRKVDYSEKRPAIAHLKYSHALTAPWRRMCRRTRVDLN